MHAKSFQVEYMADSLLLDVLQLGHSNNGLIAHHGHVASMCQEVEAGDPVTFTTGDSFLVLPKWDVAKSGSISLKVRTNEANGVLIYTIGASNGAEQSADFFAIELLEGHVFMLMNLGSGSIKVKASTKRIDDGHWHPITLRRTGKSGRVTVDDSAVDFIAPGISSQLDLEGSLFLGSVGTSSSRKSHHKLPSELWSGSLGFGFIGCVRDLVLNSDAIDIAALSQSQDSGGVKPACHPSSGHCDSKSCLNGGKCSEGWNRNSCDCSTTSFTGPTCAKGELSAT